jgi:sugar fermentation stimulation protein A
MRAQSSRLPRPRHLHIVPAMLFPGPLSRGTLIRRYKRFLADIHLDDGSAITASCPNTGTMMGLCDPGATVWLSRHASKTRKYAHRWELTEQDLGDGPQLIGINTGLPNKIVEEAVTASAIAELSSYPSMRREVNYGVNSRIDLLLERPLAERCYVEIKNVHLSRQSGLAEFPDCVSERAAKHLVELAEMVRQGHRAVMLYLIQRGDVDRFQLASDLDPAYAAGFAVARKAGVEMLAYACDVSTTQVTLTRRIPIAHRLRPSRNSS